MTVALQLRDVTTNSIELLESPILQSPSGDITYSLDVSDYGDTPTNTSVTAFNLSSGDNVSTVVLSGTTSVLGNVITFPNVSSLLLNYLYKLQINFTITSTGEPFTRFLRIQCRGN